MTRLNSHSIVDARQSAANLHVAGREYSAEQLRDWDRRHSWHPFTPMSEYFDQDAPIIVGGERNRLQDIDGRWYWDGCSSVWLNIHGHRNDAIDRAIVDQLERCAHSTTLGQANVPATVLARLLVDLAPDGLRRVQFSDCGAAAVEIAVKIAIQYWAQRGHPGKRQILGFHNNYHGDTLGAMSVAPSELFHKPFLDLLPYHPRLRYPSCASSPWVESGVRCDPQHVQEVDEYLRAHAHEVAGVIIEPVEGAGGMIPAVPGFLHELRACCDRYDVLLIVDEIATGFGHTGHLFACSAEQVTPDIFCLGKGLTGGYLPVAATMTTETVFESFLGAPRDRRTLYHGHSYAGNQLGCAAAIASIQLLPQTLSGLKEKVDALSDMLQLLRTCPLVSEIRQRGFMVGIPLCSPGARQTGEPRDGWGLRDLAMQVSMESRRLGMLIRPIGNVVILLPPPISTVADLEAMVDILNRALTSVAGRIRAAP